MQSSTIRMSIIHLSNALLQTLLHEKRDGFPNKQFLSIVLCCNPEMNIF